MMIPIIVSDAFVMLGIISDIEIIYSINSELQYRITLNSINDLSVEALLNNYVIYDNSNQLSDLNTKYTSKIAWLEEEAEKDRERTRSYPSGTYKIGVDLPAGEYAIKANSNTSGTGTFKVGYHIPTGEYNLVQVGSYSAYVEVATHPSGGLYSIVTNDNFEGTKYITVKDGQYLKITRCKIDN